MWPFKILSRRKHEAICREKSRLTCEVARLKRKVNELSDLAYRDECHLFVEQGGTYQVFRMVRDDKGNVRPEYVGRSNNLQLGIPHAPRFH